MKGSFSFSLGYFYYLLGCDFLVEFVSATVVEGIEVLKGQAFPDKVAEEVEVVSVFVILADRPNNRSVVLSPSFWCHIIITFWFGLFLATKTYEKVGIVILFDFDFKKFAEVSKFDECIVVCAVGVIRIAYDIRGEIVGDVVFFAEVEKADASDLVGFHLVLLAFITFWREIFLDKPAGHLRSGPITRQSTLLRN